MNCPQSCVDRSHTIAAIHEFPNESFNSQLVNVIHVFHLRQVVEKEFQVLLVVEVTVRRKILKLAMSHERTVRIRDKFATNSVDPLEFDFRHIFPPKIVRQIMCNPGGKIVVYAHFQA